MTIRTYISVIRAVLMEDDIKIEQDNFVLSALVRACKIKNDRLIARLPIHKDLLKILLDEIDKYYTAKGQSYLRTMYQAIFATAYFGLLRIGKIVHSHHTIKAVDVHVGTNKKKILLILRTSKTHNKGDKPQLIKIASTPCHGNDIQMVADNKYCPFHLLRKFISQRPELQHGKEDFMVYSDGSLIMPDQVRFILKRMLQKAGLDYKYYCFHGLRSGRASDLLKLGVSVETIKQIGRWKSNAVFTYLKQF